MPPRRIQRHCWHDFERGTAFKAVFDFVFVTVTILKTIQIRDSGVMSMRTQFLFMIADTESEDDKSLMELEKSVDGENVAFIYNSSTLASTCNVRLSLSV